MPEQRNESSAAESLRDDVAAYRANGSIVTDETLRDWERRLTDLAFPESNAATTEPQEEIAKLKHAISGLIPWVAGSGRGAAQEALANACELIGANPFMWSAHPDVLLRRRPDLERRHDAGVNAR